MAKPKYRSALNKPITPGLINKARQNGFEEWLKSDIPKRKYLSKMLLLLQHYQIDPSSPNRWFILALELASDHVPGFEIAEYHRGPGRPRKKSFKPTSSGSPGRKKKWTDEDAKGFVGLIERRKLNLELKYGRKVKDKETLELFIKEYAKKNKRSVQRELSEKLPYFQKKLSECRRKIREINEK